MPSTCPGHTCALRRTASDVIEMGVGSLKGTFEILHSVMYRKKRNKILRVVEEQHRAK